MNNDWGDQPRPARGEARPHNNLNQQAAPQRSQPWRPTHQRTNWRDQPPPHMDADSSSTSMSFSNEACEHPSNTKPSKPSAHPTSGHRAVAGGRSYPSAQQRSLPVWDQRDQLLHHVDNDQVFIVVGDTGCGKTTQIPQMILQHHPDDCRIACTQPRRVAAITISQRVAKEMNVVWGEEVGYCVRFDRRCCDRTRITYLTDGVLLQMSMADPEFRQFNLIILDEVHERTLATDILLGLLKDVIRRRKDLQVIIMSATMDSMKFSAFFESAPVVTIPGRTFPVAIWYCQKPIEDYLEASLETVYHILLFEPDQGHILVFLTGEEEIETAVERMATDVRFQCSSNWHLVTLPLYSRLSPPDQARVFEPVARGQRKIVFATNIAETSITIDGVSFVVDCGFSKQAMFLPGPRVSTLLVQCISKSSARQRAGRAGRTCPGICYRLYPKSSFDCMIENSAPEILCSNLSQVVLQLQRLGIRNILSFPFVDPPPRPALMRSLEELRYLSALTETITLTPIGRFMSFLPIDPPLALALLSAHRFHCTKQIAAIVAMLSLPKLTYRSDKLDQTAREDRAMSLFRHRDGDHMTLLKIYTYYAKAVSGELNKDISLAMVNSNKQASRQFCDRHFLHERSMREAVSIWTQLMNILEQNGLPTPGLDVFDYDDGGYSANVRQALCCGLFLQTARLTKDYRYQTLADGHKFALHNSCGLKGACLKNQFRKRCVDVLRGGV